VNTAFVKDPQGVWKLDLGAPSLQEAQTRFENDLDRKKIKRLPLILAKKKWGGADELAEALTDGQCWLDEKDPKVVCWLEGELVNEEGGMHQWQTQQSRELNAEQHEACKGVMAKKSKFHHALSSKPKPGTPLMLRDGVVGSSLPAAAPRQVMELLDQALIATAATLKQVDPLIAHVLRINPLPDRMSKLVQTLTDVSEDVRDAYRKVEKAPYYIFIITMTIIIIFIITIIIIFISSSLIHVYP
jgi:hypothetical protein